MAENLYGSYERRYDDNSAVDQEDDRPVAYLHLKNAQIVNPKWGPIRSEFPYWRVRLSSVSAWTLGRFEPD
jgi:hypothetical protein